MTAWINVIGWTLVHFLWEGAVIALIAAGVLRLLRRAPASARYVVACGALMIAIAAPPATLAMLTLSGASEATAIARESIVRAGTATTTPVAVEAGSGDTTGGVAVATVGSGILAAALPALVTFWAAGVLLLTLRLASGWWRVRRLHAEATGMPASAWGGTAARLGKQLGLRLAIHVIDSRDIDTPTVIGWLKPVVLLPVAALANLAPSQVEAILAHELAHIRRHDFLVNLLQTVGETVLFYHPAVWWLSSRIRIEREHCCDDIAVDVCGDPVAYAEALTAIAAFSQERIASRQERQPVSPLAVAATGGSLLHRVRRLLRLPDTPARRPVVPVVVAATVLLVILAATRLVIVAQTPPAGGGHDTRVRLGPPDINRLLGFDLFPGPARYVTDDPRGARAWDVNVAYPGGAMAFMGFTGRSVVRYAYELDAMAVVDGPEWLDAESRTIHGETSAAEPTEEDFRAAMRVALEAQYGLSIRRETRLFPIYGLQVVERGRLGPNILPSVTECFDSRRDRPGTIGPTLYARGQQMAFCGSDNTLTGITGRRATFTQLAHALHGFNMGPVEKGVPERQIVDQTGLTGVYDFELQLGLLPLSVMATAHPTLGIGFGPMIRTVPQALQEQLGLRLVPSDAPHDVAVIVTRPAQVTAQVELRDN